jgi:hypothetical protein
MSAPRTCALLAVFACFTGCGASRSGAPLPDGDGQSAPPIDPSLPRIVVSAAAPSPRTTTLSANYWMWPSAYADDVSGTEAAIEPLAPALLRMGGYNNDANVPMPFDDAALDRAVAYAAAVGAEPLLQIPLLADDHGETPTYATAAAMVSYANITRGYGIRYFSIGNEPDLYATQGAQPDMSAPAIPGYTPDAYCATAREFASAMKAVDPSIQIVGPDLSWHYVTGNDWLTPILQGCGDVFDVISFHRYPFSSEVATLEAAEPDASAFAAVIDHVRGILQATGQGDKPLALTEMNIVYNATVCQHTASPRTTGSGLWLADAFGTAIAKDLWTTAVWDISDDDGYAFGLLGPAPAHTPRPEYYAYSLYAQHLGSTRLDVLKTPARVHAYATRDDAGGATSVIAINFSTSSVPLAVEVTDLDHGPAPAAFTLPALSITAIDLPDRDPARATTYGEAERQAGSGPVALAAGSSDPVDAGPPVLDNECSSVARTCPTTTLPGAAITTNGTTDADRLVFGKDPFRWRSFTFAATGQAEPVGTVASDGNGLSIAGGFVPPLTDGNWEGLGLYLDNDHCADVSSYTGVRFDLSGDLGGCTLSFGAAFSGDLSTIDDAVRGTCAGSDDVCYPPLAPVSAPAAKKTASVEVPFSTLANGNPIPSFDATTLVTVTWQLSAPPSGACSANFTLENVAFY